MSALRSGNEPKISHSEPRRKEKKRRDSISMTTMKLIVEDDSYIAELVKDTERILHFLSMLKYILPSFGFVFVILLIILLTFYFNPEAILDMPKVCGFENYA